VAGAVTSGDVWMPEGSAPSRRWADLSGLPLLSFANAGTGVAPPAGSAMPANPPNATG
jgi:hypothetical protein